jgi:uncharacterized membrane protein
LPLPPGQGHEVSVRVEIPTSPVVPSDTVIVQARSSWNDQVYDETVLHSATYTGTLLVDDSTAWGNPGETVTHTFVITNLGTVSDTYTVTLTPGNWPALLLDQEVGPLEPGQAGLARVTVDIPRQPLTVSTLFSDILFLQATSQAVPEVGAQAEGTTRAVADLDLLLLAEVDSLVGLPGETLTYTLYLSNTGAYTDVYGLALTGNTWPSVVLPTQTLPLPPGETVEIWVRVTVPAGTAEERDRVTVRATSGWSDSIYDEADLVTRQGWMVFLPIAIKSAEGP